MGPSPFRRIAAIALGAAVAAALPAGAGVPLRDGLGIPMRWDLEVEQPNVKGGKVLLYVDPQTSQEEPPGDETETTAVDNAARTWEAVPGSPLRFADENAREAYDRDGSDRVNYLGWKEFVLSPFTLSATYTTAKNGVIYDADVIFNDTVKFVRWSTTSPGLPGFADVESVALHELGHVLGLDHSPVTTATMSWLQYTGAVSARTLEPDDAGAVLDAYPPVSEGPLGSILGIVKVGRRPAARGIPVFALDARTGGVAGCCFTSDTGRYRIRGLPPGPYRVAAAPLSTTLPFSKWWAKAPMKVLPGFHREELPAGGSAPRTVFVRAGFPEVDVDLVLERFRRRAPTEPDGGPALAREIAVGDAAAGVFEDPLDEDWFRIVAAGPGAIDVRMRSWGLGADADAEVALVGADGSTILLNRIDDRPPVDTVSFHGPLGIDRDVTMKGVVPPGGDLFLRVRSQQQSNTGAPGCFYVVEVVPSAGRPDARLSTASLSPSAVRAADGSPPTLSAVPRDWRGDPVGPGATVTAERSDGGDPVVLSDLGDGTYAAAVPLPASPGEVRFSLSIEASTGSASVPDAALLTVAGPADAARSVLVATPPRTEPGPGHPVVLVYTPRDAAGRLLGPGLAVDFAFEGTPAGTLGTPVDRLDGTYEIPLVPSPLPGSVRVGVLLAGEPAGVSRLVGFGWELPLVAADLGAFVVEATGTPGVTKKEVQEFGRAGASLDGILAGLAAGDEEAAAAAASRTVASLSRAGRGPRFPGAALAARDVAEALRRRVHGIVDVIVFPTPDRAGQKLLDAAKKVLARGDSTLSAGDPVRASGSFVRALRMVRPLLAPPPSEE